MKLGRIALRGGAAFKIADIRAFVGNDQRAFELSGVFRIDAEIGRQFHRTPHAGRNIHKRPVRKDSAIQRGIKIVRDRNHRTEILAHKVRMFANGFRDGTKDHADFFKLVLEGGANRNRVKYRINRNLSALGGGAFSAFHPCQNHLFFQRDAKFFVSGQKLGINFVQRFRLFGHAGRPRIVILILKIDLRIADHRPIGFVKFFPTRECLKAPLGHPFRFVVFFTDQLDDISVYALGGVFHLDIRVPAVFICANLGHRVHGFLIHAFFDIRIRHRHQSIRSFKPPDRGVSSIGPAMHRQNRQSVLLSCQDQC